MNTLSKISILLFLCPLIVFFSYTKPGEIAFNEKANSLLNSRLSDLKKNILAIKTACKKKQPATVLKPIFYSARSSYKKAAVFIEYFNPYETKILNGPNLQRIESETPDNIIAPSGFQVIEDYLYNNKIPPYEDIIKQADIMLKTIARIETEPDGKLKFKEDLVFAALQSSLVGMMAMGITGFDSPVAFRSLQEASANLDGFKTVFDLYKQQLQKSDNNLYLKIITAINTCKNYLAAHQNFNSFNRLDFITGYINPLSELLTRAGKKMNLLVSMKNRPVNNMTGSIFSADAFNADFFSPGPPYEITAKRIELGKLLFYDPILSGTKKKSCASCHKPELAFGDGLKTALSIDDSSYLLRNTPTLWNSVFQTKLFWDSRTTILENQLDEVVHNEKEMEGSLKESVALLKKDEKYAALFKEAYPDEKITIVEFNIANAISSYVRSLVSLNSRFDKYVRGNKKALNAEEKNGFNLFAGKAKCATCHFIPLFNGLVPPVFTETESEVVGVPQTKNKKNPVLDPDTGRFGFTTSVIHRFAFKTPTIRNIELTAPYMHNGVYTTLEEVMEFYNNGGGKGLKIAPENQTLPFDKLNLSPKEIKDIISFMKSLTDTTYNSAAYK